MLVMIFLKQFLGKYTRGEKDLRSSTETKWIVTGLGNFMPGGDTSACAVTCSQSMLSARQRVLSRSLYTDKEEDILPVCTEHAVLARGQSQKVKCQNTLWWRLRVLEKSRFFCLPGVFY